MGLSTGQIALAVTNFALPLMATPSDLYASIMQSETLLRAVVDSLDLVTEYRVVDTATAVAILKDNLNVKVERDGIIVIEADSRDRNRAAEIANLLVSLLDTMNREMLNRKGREFSRFLERRVAEVDSELATATRALVDFQETHGVVALERQSEALIEILAEQKSSLTTAEIKLQMLKSSLDASHPEVIKQAQLVREVRNKLHELESGASNRTDSVISALEVPLMRVPELTLQFAVFKRDIRILELTYELLSQQLEMARLQEQRDTPTIIRLDQARPPSKAMKPSKRMIVITAFCLSFLLTAAVFIVRDQMRQPGRQNVDLWNRVTALLTELRRRPLG
jgi:uncharacterized protein involved in exopolysaccharide biosynthesis